MPRHSISLLRWALAGILFGVIATILGSHYKHPRNSRAPIMSEGTIPSMESAHQELKSNTAIVGKFVKDIDFSFVINTDSSIVLGASGDLAKKKVP